MPAIAKKFLRELKRAVNRKLNKIDKGEATNIFQIELTINGKTEIIRIKEKRKEFKLLKFGLLVCFIEIFILDFEKIINFF